MCFTHVSVILFTLYLTSRVKYGGYAGALAVVYLPPVVEYTVQHVRFRRCNVFLDEKRSGCMVL